MLQPIWDRRVLASWPFGNWSTHPRYIEADLFPAFLAKAFKRLNSILKANHLLWHKLSWTTAQLHQMYEVWTWVFVHVVSNVSLVIYVEPMLENCTSFHWRWACTWLKRASLLKTATTGHKMELQTQGSDPTLPSVYSGNKTEIIHMIIFHCDICHHLPGSPSATGQPLCKRINGQKSHIRNHDIEKPVWKFQALAWPAMEQRNVKRRLHCETTELQHTKRFSAITYWLNQDKGFWAHYMC